MRANSRKHKIKSKKELIEDRYNSLDIYEMYIGKIKTIPCTIKSPLRGENRSSFSLFGKSVEALIFKDHASEETGNVYQFVMLHKNLSFKEAVDDIFKTMGLNECVQIKPKTKHNLKIGERKLIQIRPILDSTGLPKYTTKELKYWNTFGISKNTLINNRVYACEYVYKDSKLIYSKYNSELLFAYVYVYNDEYYYKIYRPLELEWKFDNDFAGVSKYLLHGIWTLPKKGDKLIITSSAKDKMSLEEIGLHAIAVQAEGLPILEQHLKYYSKSFTDIYLLYDNDYMKEKNWGQLHAQKRLEEYPFLKNIYIPTKYKSKDSSDLYKHQGEHIFKEVINNLIS